MINYHKLAVSDVVAKSLVRNSERKHNPNHHYDLVIKLPRMSDSDFDYGNKRLNAVRALVTPEEFEINQKISGDADGFISEFKDDVARLRGLEFNKKLSIFKNEDIDFKALIYLDMDEASEEEGNNFQEFLGVFPWDIEKEVLDHLKFRKMTDGLHHKGVQNGTNN